MPAEYIRQSIMLGTITMPMPLIYRFHHIGCHFDVSAGQRVVALALHRHWRSMQVSISLSSVDSQRYAARQRAHIADTASSRSFSGRLTHGACINAARSRLFAFATATAAAFRRSERTVASGLEFSRYKIAEYDATGGISNAPSGKVYTFSFSLMHFQYRLYAVAMRAPTMAILISTT